MFWPKHLTLCLSFALAGGLAASAVEYGRPATRDEVTLWDIDVRPDGIGLPEGSGNVARGRQVYEESCVACHGDRGQGGVADRLAGGRGSLASAQPVKTVGSFWPYATTLFDYVRRSMPYPAPQTLSDDDTYAVVAYMLSLSDILPPDATLNRANLPTIRMPNREGFVPDPEFSAFHNSRGGAYQRP
jgi:cytochrome c